MVPIITINVIKQQSFVCQTILFQAIQFTISHLFALSLSSVFCLQSMKRLQVLLFNTNYSIQHYSLILLSNVSKYCYVKPIIKYRHINSSIQHYSFVCTQLNGSKYCYVSLTIQLSISHLFTHSWMIKQFYF